MNSRTHKILLKNDNTMETRKPIDFNYKTALQEVHNFAADATRYGFNFSVDESIQDASFFSDVFDPVGIRVRFSSFGRLVCIFNGNVRKYSSQDFPQEIIGLLYEHRFVVIRPEELVASAYEGRHPSFQNNDLWNHAWFIRFFDYL